MLPGDVARRDAGDQDKWLPGTAVTPTSVATFAAFATDAANGQDDIKAAAARVAAGTSPSASAASPSKNMPVAASKMSVTAAAAAFTASAAAAAAAALSGMQAGVDAVKQSSPGGSATKGSAGKKAKSHKGKHCCYKLSHCDAPGNANANRFPLNTTVSLMPPAPPPPHTHTPRLPSCEVHCSMISFCASVES